MILSLFKKNVKNIGIGNAIITDDKRISYHELDLISDQVCLELLQRNIQVGEIVPVVINRSWEFVAAILGVLKAGCLYMPIDIKTPKERMKFMLQNSECRVVLYKGQLPEYIGDVTFVNISTISIAGDVKYREHENAYIMYTSGSTGLPKGVIIRQKGIIKLVRNVSFVSLFRKTNVLFTSATTFDPSMFEIFGCILNGGTLYIVNDDVLFDANLLKAYINQNHINTIWFTSPLFNQLIDTNSTLFDSPHMQYLIVGGDVLSPRHINKVLQSRNRIKIINGYGPTENTVFSTAYQIENIISSATVPIGKAISKSVAYILTNELKLAEIGEEGEIFVGGDGLMEGYFKDHSLTNDKLIKNPFKKNSNLYKTGDIGFLDKNGDIHFVGRRDSQIKINGHRVDTNEIRYVINEYGTISDSLVIYYREEDVLVTYIICQDEFNEAGLKAYLLERLPKYMIPNLFVKTDLFPLNSSGKIDVKKLSKPELGIVRQVNSDSIENKIIIIYSRILNVNVSVENFNDSFFNLGGSSIKIFKLLHEIEKNIGVTISISDFFKNPTINFLIQTIQKSFISDARKLKKIPDKEYYRTSFAQKRLVFLQELYKKNISYNIVSAFHITGKIDTIELEKLFSQLLVAHESLRTSFVLVDDKEYQQINDNYTITIENLGNGLNMISHAISKFIKPFDLKKSLFRMGIVHLSDDEKIIVLDIHHCIFDGISLKILVKDFYHLLNGEVIKTKEFTYKDYSEWQHTAEYSQLISQQKDFWLSIYRNSEVPILNVTSDKVRPLIFSSAGKSINFEFNQELTSKLKTISSEQGVTIFMLLYSLFNMLLSKLSDQDDIIIGVPVSGRTHPDLEEIVGLFVNTLPFRVEINRDKNFAGYMQDVKAFSVQAFDNQDYPLEELINVLKVDRDLCRNPLFDVLFSYLDFDYTDVKYGENFNMKIRPYPVERKSTSFDLTLIATVSDDKFRFSLEYYSDVFEAKTIKQFVSVFRTIAETIADDCHALIKDIPMLAPDAQSHYLHQESSTVDTNQSIVSLFLNQVSKTPKKNAVIFNEAFLTYSTLKEKASAFAQYIISQGIKENSVIAIRFERSPDIISAMLGIMFAGCSYLPLDPDLPLDRCLFVIKKASASAIISSKKNIMHEIKGVKTLYIEDVPLDASTAFLPNFPNPKSLAYIIYTSGSTGEPKGVAINHESIVNTLLWRKHYYNFNSSDMTLQIPSYFFDSSVEDIFTPLISGSCLLMANAIEMRDMNLLVELLYKYKVTNFLMIPSLYNEALSRIERQNHHLRFVTLAGESINENLVNKHFKRLSDVELYNEYGPTECSVCATVYKFSEENTKVLIGKPITGIYCYVLNKDMNHCPNEIAGELYLHGIGLARGYHCDIQQTNKVFLPNPFGDGILYKTGDIVKRDENNNLEFIARSDYQIKIRGFRIEIEEIEFQLYKFGNIKEAVVVKDLSRELICAFFTSEEEIDIGRIKNHLASQLPAYMVPDYIKRLFVIPKTNTGKINRKALSLIEIQAKNNEQNTPSNDLEIALLNIWKSIIKSDEVDINDNFFESGGNSINILSFQNIIEKELRLVLSVDSFFQYPNILKLSDYCKSHSLTDVETEDESIDLLNNINLFNQD